MNRRLQGRRELGDSAVPMRGDQIEVGGPKLGHNRLGLPASVKLGHAVVRNRARRRLREVYRLHLGELAVGWDIILVARSRTVTASWKELNDTFLRLCRKLDLLRDKP